MSEDRHPAREKLIAETVAATEAPEAAPLLGTMQMAESALRSPTPRAEAEAASFDRALSAFEGQGVAQNPLHPEAWRAGTSSLAARLGGLIKRFRDRG